MSVPFQQPSLAELLQAYKEASPAKFIDSLSQGVQTGMGIAAQRQKAQLDQQNKLAELANQGITANASMTSAQAAQASAAAEAQKAQAAQREAEAKFLTPEQSAALAAGQMPQGVVPSSVADSYNSIQAKKQELATQLRQAQMMKDASLANTAAIAGQASEDRKAKIENDKRVNEINQGTAAQKDAGAIAPGFWSALGNYAYGHTIGHGQDLPKVQQFHALQNEATNLLGQSVVGSPAQPKSVLGQSPTVTIKASDGTMHVLPSQNLQAAKQRDPGLQVIQ